MDTAWLLLLSPLAGMTLNLLLQIASFRLLPRLGLLKSVFVGFGAGFAATVTLTACISTSTGEYQFISELLTAVLLFGALGYGYFHFINLTETARRIRLLREFVDAGGELSMEQILERYNASMIVNVRLNRLLGTQQVVRREGKLFISRPTLLIMMRTMDLLGLLLMGRDKKNR